jgi:hypothetical protein
MKAICALLGAVALSGCVVVPVGPPIDAYGYTGYVEPPSATIVVRPWSSYDRWQRDGRHRWRRW